VLQYFGKAMNGRVSTAPVFERENAMG